MLINRLYGGNFLGSVNIPAAHLAPSSEDQLAANTEYAKLLLCAFAFVSEVRLEGVAATSPDLDQEARAKLC